MPLGQTLRFRWRLSRLMALIAVVAVGLFVAREGPVWRYRYEHWRYNKPLHDQLRRRIDLPFPRGATLEILLKYVQASTRCPELPPKGLPSYIDEVGCFDAGFPMETLLVIDAKDAPLGESLLEILEPRGLGWYVQDRLMTITDRATAEAQRRYVPKYSPDAVRGGRR